MSHCPGANTTTCYACAYSGMEPDGEARLICFHPEAGEMGKYIGLGRGPNPQPLPFCRGRLFKQHELRNADGSLKKGK